MHPKISTERIDAVNRWAEGLSDRALCIIYKQLLCAVKCFDPRVDDVALGRAFAFRQNAVIEELKNRKILESANRLNIMCVPWYTRDSASATWTLTDFSTPADYLIEKASREQDISSTQESSLTPNKSVVVDLTNADTNIMSDAPVSSIDTGIDPSIFENPFSMDADFADFDFILNIPLQTGLDNPHIRARVEEMHRESQNDFSGLPIVSSWFQHRTRTPDTSHISQTLRCEIDVSLSTLIREFSFELMNMSEWANREWEWRHQEAYIHGKLPQPPSALELYHMAYKEVIEHTLSVNNDGASTVRLTKQSWEMESKVLREYYKQCANRNRECHHAAFPRG